MPRLKTSLHTIVIIAFILSLSLRAAPQSSETPPEAEFAAALIAAKSDDERNAMLDQKRDLITPLLLTEAFKKTQQLYAQAEFGRALSAIGFLQTLAARIGDKSGSATAFMQTGHVYNLQGDYPTALEYYNKALAGYKLAENRAGVAKILLSIGVLYNSQGNNRLALEYEHKALTEFEALKDKFLTAASLNNMGVSYYSQGNYDQALEYYKKAFSLYEELNIKQNLPTTLNNIGIIYSLQGDPASAFQYYEKSLKLYRELLDKKGIGMSLHNIGEDLQRSGDYKRALEYFQDSLKIKEEAGIKPGIAATLTQIGKGYYLQGDYSKALEYVERASSVAREINMRDQLWQAQNIAGRACLALKRYDQAEKSFKESVEAVEDLRAQVSGGEREKQRFFENKTDPYYGMASLLISQNRSAEALSYAERAKARALLDVVQSGRVRITKEMSPAEQEQERKLANELTTLNTQIARASLNSQPDEPRLAVLNKQLLAARADFEVFQTSLYAAHPQLKVQRGDFRPFELTEAAELIADAKTALIEYAVADDKTYLFVLTKSADRDLPTIDLKAYEIDISRKDLFDRAQNFRKMMADRNLGFRGPAMDLYNLLIKPAADQLRGIANIIIVPDGALWELPFQALMPQENRYLLEDQAVSYAPSLTVLREFVRLRRKDRSEAPTQLLAFGNPLPDSNGAERIKPVLRDAKLAPLPEAEKEVKKLALLYGATRSKVFVGAEASEERFKSESGSCRLLHISSHSILNDSSPMYSQVILSQPKENEKEDGLLEAWELMQMDLHADMAILSACETARGRVAAGEGVIGLSWALFVAGCPTTVVSQWKVEAASTSDLMLEFHKNLKPNIEGASVQTTKSEALRKAALRILRDSRYKHPFYWAGFVMVGSER